MTQETNVQIVKIVEGKWLEGNFAVKEGVDSLLLSSESGRMCCLGFLCLQIGGVDEEEIMDLTTPADLYRNHESSMLQLGLVREAMEELEKDSPLTVDLMTINDEPSNLLSAKNRVDRLNEACEKWEASFRFQLVDSLED